MNNFIKNKRGAIICLLCISMHITLIINATAQSNDSIQIAAIYKNALQSHESYKNLQILCEQSAPRELGSENSVRAVNLLKSMLDSLNCDTVFLQAYKTDVWNHLSGTSLYTSINGEKYDFKVNALGPSVPTSNEGFGAEVIEVFGISELKSMDNELVKDKIVFFNNIMDNCFVEPVNAYIDAVQPRLFGANVASEKGAVACIMRSISTIEDNYIHTGCMRYDNHSENIPAVAISTRDADRLSKLLKNNSNVKLNMVVESEILKGVETYNVVAEIRGHEKADEVIVIGAHIDTWFNTPGAHDDGAGCVQMIDVLRIINELKIHNNRTIRVILFMDEEMNKSGAKAYLKQYSKKNEMFIAAIESDLGGFEPCGFLIDGTNLEIEKIQSFGRILQPYGLNRIEKGFGGGDMIVLKKQFGFPSIALKVNSQRYFEIIHTQKDTFDKVNRRELQLGSAAITSLVYLIDKYGLNKL